MKNDNEDRSLYLDLLDKYASENVHLSKPFTFLKNFFSNYIYIDKDTTITILKENCDKIHKIITENNRIPIIIIPNDSFRSSNFFLHYILCICIKIKQIIL